MRLVCWVAAAAMMGCSGAAVNEEVVFSEKFQDELAEGWHWLREQPEDWRLQDGGLELRARPGDAHTVTTALLHPAPSLAEGPLIFEVTVTFLDELTEQFEQAGLTWYDDGEPVFKLVHELVDGEMMIIPGRALTESQTVTLRLLVSEGHYEAQYREEGEEAFHTVDAGELSTGTDSHISLLTYHGPEDAEHWVRFTDFRVLRAN